MMNNLIKALRFIPLSALLGRSFQLKAERPLSSPITPDPACFCAQRPPHSFNLNRIRCGFAPCWTQELKKKGEQVYRARTVSLWVGTSCSPFHEISASYFRLEEWSNKFAEDKHRSKDLYEAANLAYRMALSPNFFVGFNATGSLVLSNLLEPLTPESSPQLGSPITSNAIYTLPSNSNGNFASFLFWVMDLALDFGIELGFEALRFEYHCRTCSGAHREVYDGTICSFLEQLPTHYGEGMGELTCVSLRPFRIWDQLHLEGRWSSTYWMDVLTRGFPEIIRRLAKEFLLEGITLTGQTLSPLCFSSLNLFLNFDYSIPLPIPEFSRFFSVELQLHPYGSDGDSWFKKRGSFAFNWTSSRKKRRTFLASQKAPELPKGLIRFQGF